MTRPRLDGLHHVKIPVSDLAVALDHYERAFGAVRLPEADHFRPDGELFAYICQVDGLDTLLELPDSLVSLFFCVPDLDFQIGYVLPSATPPVPLHVPINRSTSIDDAGSFCRAPRCQLLAGCTYSHTV